MAAATSRSSSSLEWEGLQTGQGPGLQWYAGREAGERPCPWEDWTLGGCWKPAWGQQSVLVPLLARRRHYGAAGYGYRQHLGPVLWGSIWSTQMPGSWILPGIGIGGQPPA